jgi:hypothetical protein
MDVFVYTHKSLGLAIRFYSVLMQMSLSSYLQTAVTGNLCFSGLCSLDIFPFYKVCVVSEIMTYSVRVDHEGYYWKLQLEMGIVYFERLVRLLQVKSSNVVARKSVYCDCTHASGKNYLFCNQMQIE